MDTSKIDKSLLKSVIREVIKEDITLFKEVIKEVLVENQVIATDEQGKRRKRLEQLIDSNFDKYDDVFKALA